MSATYKVNPGDVDENEVHIDIHLHCEHCFAIKLCEEKSKKGWACPIILCPNGCRHR